MTEKFDEIPFVPHEKTGLLFDRNKNPVNEERYKKIAMIDVQYPTETEISEIDTTERAP